MSEYAPQKSFSSDEKTTLTEHGWRVENSSMKMVIKDGKFTLVEDDLWLDTTYGFDAVL